MVADLNETVLSQGLKHVLFDHFGSGVDLDERHVLLQILLDAGAKFNHNDLQMIEEDSHSSITDNVINVLFRRIPTEQNKTLKEFIPVIRSKKLAGRIAYIGKSF